MRTVPCAGFAGGQPLVTIGQVGPITIRPATPASAGRSRRKDGVGALPLAPRKIGRRADPGAGPVGFLAAVEPNWKISLDAQRALKSIVSPTPLPAKLKETARPFAFSPFRAAALALDSPIRVFALTRPARPTPGLARNCRCQPRPLCQA